MRVGPGPPSRRKCQFLDDGGAVSTEYLFLVVFIALAIVIGAATYGGALNGAFGRSSTEVDGQVAGQVGSP